MFNPQINPSNLTLYGGKILFENTKIKGYNPYNFTFFNENFQIIEKIYEKELSASIVSQGIDLKANEKVAIKELRKEFLREPYQHEMAKIELSVHHSLSQFSDNIVNAPYYFENDDSYLLVMEYCEEPNFFENLLENVKY
jgi:serine/threonine protein kinase